MIFTLIFSSEKFVNERKDVKIDRIKIVVDRGSLFAIPRTFVGVCRSLRVVRVTVDRSMDLCNLYGRTQTDMSNASRRVDLPFVILVDYDFSNDEDQTHRFVENAVTWKEMISDPLSYTYSTSERYPIIRKTSMYRFSSVSEATCPSKFGYKDIPHISSRYDQISSRRE